MLRTVVLLFLPTIPQRVLFCFIFTLFSRNRNHIFFSSNVCSRESIASTCISTILKARYIEQGACPRRSVNSDQSGTRFFTRQTGSRRNIPCGLHPKAYHSCHLGFIVHPKSVPFGLCRSYSSASAFAPHLYHFVFPD